jgi:hypothetical protein
MTTTEVPPAGRSRRRRFPRIVKRIAKMAGIAIAALVVAVTAASFGYNLATDGPAPRPAHLLFATGGGWQTRYLQWGTHGTPVVLVPGAFETAGTFAALGPVLAKNHRVFAIDLSGTGYSAPNPPFSAGHLAGQILAFLDTEKLTVARCGRRTFIGLNDTLKFALDVHGPRQELRAASAPICRRRQSFAGPEPLSMRERIAPATAGSLAVAGSKTKARSFA